MREADAERRHVAERRVPTKPTVLADSSTAENTNMPDKQSRIRLKMQNVRCKLRVTKVTQFEQPEGTGQVSLAAVFESKDGVVGNACTENHVFGQYTPCAEFSMTILNPAAFQTFRDALDSKTPFYVDFVPAID